MLVLVYTRTRTFKRNATYTLTQLSTNFTQTYHCVGPNAGLGIIRHFSHVL